MAGSKRSTRKRTPAFGFSQFMRAVQTADPATLPATAACDPDMERVKEIAGNLLGLLRVGENLDWMSEAMRRKYAWKAADAVSRAANSDDPDEREGAQLAMRVLVSRLM